LGARSYGLGGGIELGFEQGLFGLQALEFVEGVAVIALGHIDAALEAGEGFLHAVERLAEDGAVDLIAHALLPDFGLYAAEAAEEPFAIDEGIDEHALLGGIGEKAAVILELEAFEVGGGFVVDDLGVGVDAGFEGVH
jgi:hypothetical protein